VTVTSRSADELLATLYREHGDALTRYVRHLTRDGSTVEDVVQEAMVRAWQRPAVLERAPDSARAWLFTVARNLVVDEARSAHNRREHGTEHRWNGSSRTARTPCWTGSWSPTHSRR
jgi:RNA polymerase sigma-70 factor (ECF subfamily)